MPAVYCHKDEWLYMSGAWQIEGVTERIKSSCVTQDSVPVFQGGGVTSILRSGPSACGSHHTHLVKVMHEGPASRGLVCPFSSPLILWLAQMPDLGV
jgi:hypothetical protein